MMPTMSQQCTRYGVGLEAYEKAASGNLGNAQSNAGAISQNMDLAVNFADTISRYFLVLWAILNLYKS